MRISYEPEVNTRIDSYVNYEDMTGDAMSAIDAGLKLKKEKKKSGKRDLSPLDMGDDFGGGLPIKKKKTTNLNSNSNSTEFAKKLSLITGNATLQNDGVVGGRVFRGVSSVALSAFPSVRLGNEVIVTGRYYFEIHLITNGLIQIGWCGKNHGCNEEEENGVGDDGNSWSFGISGVERSDL